jgi:hypothetical protein
VPNHGFARGLACLAPVGCPVPDLVPLVGAEGAAPGSPLRSCIPLTNANALSPAILARVWDTVPEPSPEEVRAEEARARVAAEQQARSMAEHNVYVSLTSVHAAEAPEGLPADWRALRATVRITASPQLRNILAETVGRRTAGAPEWSIDSRIAPTRCESAFVSDGKDSLRLIVLSGSETSVESSVTVAFLGEPPALVVAYSCVCLPSATGAEACAVVEFAGLATLALNESGP